MSVEKTTAPSAAATLSGRPTGIKTITKDFLADTTNRWMVAIFAVAAYLVLINLDAAPLWHDEAIAGLMAKMFLKTGGLDAWDGRTFYIGINGTAANSDLKIASFPPWPMLPSALGIALFGVTDFAMRIFHSLIGLASLWLFWLLLRIDFPDQRRLRVLAFALFALSTQVLLFMRVGRYVADTFFFTLLIIYTYRLYMAPGGKPWHLAVATGATVLNFFNHFTIAAAFALALAAWHLIYHWRSTTRRQWQEIAVAGAVSAALCLWYLVEMKILFSDEQLEFDSETYETPFMLRKLVLIFQGYRDLLWFGLLPLWVAVWFALHIGHKVYRYLRPKEEEDEKRKARGKKAAKPAPRVRIRQPLDDKTKQLIRWTVLWMLFLFFTSLLSVRDPIKHSISDTRYVAPILFFTALVCAAFVDWLWQWRAAGKPVALTALALLLTTNIFSQPYAYPNVLTQQKVYATLPNLLTEVHHRSYRNYLSDALFFLRTYGKQDETIYAHPWQEFTVLQYYLSEKFIFCCSLDGNSPLPRHKMRQFGVPFYENDIRPDWLVIADPELLELPDYRLVYQSDSYAYPTNRPELEFHTFTPMSLDDVQKLFQRGIHPLGGPLLYMRIYRKIK